MQLAAIKNEVSNIHLGSTLKDGGDTLTAQEIGCHFSGNDSNILKLSDFFRNDLWPKAKESFWAYLE